MARYRRQSHVVYHCNYHIVWVSKYRFRIMEGVLKKLLEQDVYLISEWKHVQIEEMNIQKDHIQLVVSIPPK